MGSYPASIFSYRFNVLGYPASIHWALFLRASSCDRFLPWSMQYDRVSTCSHAGKGHTSSISHRYIVLPDMTAVTEPFMTYCITIDKPLFPFAETKEFWPGWQSFRVKEVHVLPLCIFIVSAELTTLHWGLVLLLVSLWVNLKVTCILQIVSSCDCY